jgi:hypothetical protein
MISNRPGITRVLFKGLPALTAKAALILTCATPLLGRCTDSVPPSKQGLWEFQRSFKGGPEGIAPESSCRRRANPSKDFER